MRKILKKKEIMPTQNANDARRKRINLYKKILISIIVSMIVLPTLLCIVLFIRISFLEKDLTNANGELLSVQERIEPLLNNMQNQQQTESAVVEPTTAEPETETETETETQLSEQELVSQALAEGRKVVYLTFDDGPCGNTNNLLDVLDKYNVKVTFFVNYHEGYANEYKRIVEDGHTLAMHTVSHNYAKVYGSVEQFKSEVVTLQDYLEEITGVKTSFFRFPGGSSNAQTKIPIADFITYLDEAGITYFDWNVTCGDGGTVNEQQCIDNVINGVNKVDVSIVLLHDSTAKLSTYEAIDNIIEKLQEMNVLILPITEETIPVKHVTK